MNYPLLSKLMGWVFVVLALAFAGCCLMGWWFPDEVSETLAIRVFGILCVVNLLVAVALFAKGRKAIPRIFRKEALAIVGLGWIVASLIGALPYYFLLEDCDFSSAFFESASGISTTGASVFSDFNDWPHSLVFWRQLSQWIGGLGVVVLFVAILSLVGAGARILFYQENTTDHQDLRFGRIRNGIFQLFSLYLILSVLCYFAYRLAGMEWFDALAHMLSTVSTAGFSTHPDSLRGYDSLAIEMVAMFFMAICGMTFFILIRAVRRPLELWRDTEIQSYLLIILGATFVATVYLAASNLEIGPGPALRLASFQVISTMSTTGFSTADYTLWPAALLTLILGCTIIGGCSGSTSGGFKVIRVLLVFKLFRTVVERSYRPNVYRPVRLRGKLISHSGIDNLLTYLLLTVLTLLVSFVLIAILQHDSMSIEGQYSAVIACFFNVGPGLAEVGPFGNYAMVTPAAKVLLGLLMIMGRLEIFALLALLSPSLWKRFQ